MRRREADIAELYRRHGRELLLFLVRRTADPETALDLWAETFAQATAGRRRFRGRTEDEAAAWLYGIARHQLSAWYRRGVVERRGLQRLRIERRELTEVEHERIVDLAG
ncbi:MAG TPA: sigma factor, partial [Solirubrobacteraceae bacterium]|nr:sigma factor [Solirubrobacteraceae bacterium]